jgi:hypothetical protein
LILEDPGVQKGSLRRTDRPSQSQLFFGFMVVLGFDPSSGGMLYTDASNEPALNGF